MAITFKKKYKDEMTGEWACPVCEVKMDSQHAFTVHIRQHNPTDHSHTCSICSKQLSSASSLDRHMLIHSGERPFKCRVCNMAFTTNGNMHRHEKTHGICGPGSRVRASTGQDQVMSYLNSSNLDEDGLRIRSKKKRKPKSLPNSNSPNNTNAQSHNSSFGCFDDLSLKETFLSLLQLQQQNRNFNGDFNFDENSSSLNVPALNKPDLADFSSIFAVISNAQLQFPFNDQQMAKLNQLASINQQNLQDQSTLLNSNNLSTVDTKQGGKRSRNGNQINGISAPVTNGQSNGKRVKRESKNSIENTSTTKEDDQRSDKSSAKNGSDIENEMINSNKQLMNDKISTLKLNSSTTSQQLTNNDDTIDDNNTIEDEDEFSRNLSEEEEVNKMEQEFSEQIKDDEKKTSEEPKDKLKSISNSEDKRDEQIKVSNDLLKNGLSSLIMPKKSTAPVNLADLIIKSDKNNNKNMRNNNNGTDLNQHLFIDPMAEDDVKLLEKQLQDQQYLCKNCGLEVRSVNTLRRHQRLHEAGGQLYECNFCNYTSLDKSSLIRHLRTHNGERPYQCTICKYAFTTKANCERHVRKRHKKIEKKDICYSMQYKAGGNTNTEAFSQLDGGQPISNNQNEPVINSSLENLPPSSLVETNKSLLASSNMHLIPHVFYEPNSMETSCRFCNKDFLFNRLLKQHIRTMMNNNFTKKPYNCILCNQGFTTKNACIRHFEKNHKDVPHDQIQNMIIENRSLLDDQRLNNSVNRLSNRGLNASALAAFSSTTGSGSSELMSNGDSSELDQPLNLANGFYSSLNKLNKHLSNDKYMMDDEDFLDDEENQDALDLSVKSNERTSIDQLSSMSRSLDLSAGSTNNQLNEPNGDIIRSAISALLAIQSAMPKSLNNDNQLMANSLLGNQTNNLNANMGNLLAAQQLQNNLNSGSLLNLFTSLNNLSTLQF